MESEAFPHDLAMIHQYFPGILDVEGRLSDDGDEPANPPHAHAAAGDSPHAPPPAHRTPPPPPAGAPGAGAAPPHHAHGPPPSTFPTELFAGLHGPVRSGSFSSFATAAAAAMAHAQAAAAARARTAGSLAGSLDGFLDAPAAAEPAFIIDGDDGLDGELVTPLAAHRAITTAQPKASQPQGVASGTAAAGLAAQMQAAGLALHQQAPVVLPPPLPLFLHAAQPALRLHAPPAQLGWRFAGAGAAGAPAGGAAAAPAAAPAADGALTPRSRRGAALAARARVQGWTGTLAAPESSSSGATGGSGGGGGSEGGARHSSSGTSTGTAAKARTPRRAAGGAAKAPKRPGAPDAHRKRARSDDEGDADYTAHPDASGEPSSSGGGRGGGGAGAGGGGARAGKVVLRPKGFKAERGASSLLKGVSRHKNTGKFEAHLWDGSYIRLRESKRPRGRQIYLGSFDTEEAAGRCYDVAAILFLGPTAPTNFEKSEYDTAALAALGREEALHELRRRGGAAAKSPGTGA